MQEAMRGRLPGRFGIELVSISPGACEARLELKPEHLAPNEFLHAATVVAIADSCAGMGCIASLPEEAAGFTTIELKTNFLRSAKDGTITCEARLLHGGRTTQLWDAAVTDDGGKTLALFRCTQLILYPREAG